MDEYPKIKTMFLRDLMGKSYKIIEGAWANDEFAFLSNNIWTFTEKVDGMNIRVKWKDGNMTFCGRTDKAQIPIKLLNRLNELFLPKIDIFKKIFNKGVCLYGEGYGAGIQKYGSNYNQNQDFVLFDVKIGDWWLKRSVVEKVASELGIDVVPIVGEGTLYDASNLVKAGITSRWGNFQAEGIVAYPNVELKTRNGDRIITKLKTRDF